MCDIQTLRHALLFVMFWGTYVAPTVCKVVILSKWCVTKFIELIVALSTLIAYLCVSWKLECQLRLLHSQPYVPTNVKLWLLIGSCNGRKPLFSHVHYMRNHYIHHYNWSPCTITYLHGGILILDQNMHTKLRENPTNNRMVYIWEGNWPQCKQQIKIGK